MNSYKMKYPENAAKFMQISYHLYIMLFTHSLSLTCSILGMQTLIILASTLWFQYFTAKTNMLLTLLEEIYPKETYAMNQDTPHLAGVL